MKRLFAAGVGLAVWRVRLARPTSTAGPYYRGRCRMHAALYLDRILYRCKRWWWFGSSTWDTAGSINTSGGLVGGTVGYNYQISHFVVGAEADIDWASISGTTTPQLAQRAVRPAIRGCRRCVDASAMPPTASCPSSQAAPHSATSTLPPRRLTTSADKCRLDRSAQALNSPARPAGRLRPNTSTSISAN